MNNNNSLEKNKSNIVNFSVNMNMNIRNKSNPKNMNSNMNNSNINLSQLSDIANTSFPLLPYD
jgi:hypothetical protein